MGTNDLYYIKVSGIQPDITDDDMRAYFQTARCGSGIVQEVTDIDEDRTTALVGIEGLIMNPKSSAKLHKGSHKINGKKVKVEKAEAKPPPKHDKQKALVGVTFQDSPPSSINVSTAVASLPPQSPTPFQTRLREVKLWPCTRDDSSMETPSPTTLGSQPSIKWSKSMQRSIQRRFQLSFLELAELNVYIQEGSVKEDPRQLRQLQAIPLTWKTAGNSSNIEESPEGATDSNASDPHQLSAQPLTVDTYLNGNQRSPTEDDETVSAVVCMEGVGGLKELHLEVAFDDGENGGEIEEIVWKEDIALVTFKDAKASDRVASEGTWRVMGRSIKVSLHQREPDPLKETLAQYTRHNTLVLKGLLPTVTDDHLRLHLEKESGMKEISRDYKLDRKGETALMRLFRSNAEDVFQKLSSSDLPLVNKTDARLIVERVSPVDTVLMEGIGDDMCNKEFLTMYFQNKKKSGAGGNVTVGITGRGHAAVTFEDITVIKHVLSHNHAKMLGQKASVKLYHPIFSHWSKTDGPCISQPLHVNPMQHKRFAVPVTTAVLRHLKRTDPMNQLNKKLNGICANVTLSEQGILVEPTTGSEWDRQWVAQCRDIIDSFFDTIIDITLDVPLDVMDKVYPVIMAQVHNPNVTISPSGCGNQVALVGSTFDIEELQAEIKKIVYENLDTTKNQTFALPVLVLIDQCVRQRLKGVHNNVLFGVNVRDKMLQVSGTDVGCDRFLKDVQKLHPQVVDVHLGEEAVRLLASRGGKMLNSMIGEQAAAVGHYFSDAHGNLPSSDVAVVTRLHLVSESIEKAKEAAQTLQSTIVSLLVDVPEEFKHTVHTDAWVSMQRQIESTFFARLSPQLEKKALVIVCDVVHAQQIPMDLKQFIRDKCYKASTIEFEWLQWEYLEKYSKRWAQLVGELKVSGLELQLPDAQRIGPSAVIISGEATPVANFVHRMHEILSGIHSGRKVISKPGVVKCFKTSSGRNALKGIAASQQAVAKVCTPEEEAEEAVSMAPAATSLKHRKICHGTTIDGRIVNIMQGDLTDFSVDVIVNAANERLSHGGGIAGLISKKGGPEIQRESDNFVKSSGELSTGDAILLKAVGTLPCKALVHAVGPRWSGGHAHEEAYLAKAVCNSLMEVSKHNYTSIAFPAISSGIFGVPVHVCARAMMKGINDFSAMGHPPQLHSITIMLFQDEHISTFTQAARGALHCFNDMEKQGKGASASQRLPPSHASSQNCTTLSIPKQRSSVQDLELKKGSLTSYQAEVYVNTAHHKLDLQNGAVSQSLLKAGGSALQDDCNRVVASRGSIPYWDIATTTGGNLQCQHVIHTVGEQYKSGSSEKKMESMITKVMQECTRLNASSVAFPALGTGNLGFPEDVVAEVMVRTISDYLRQNPSTSVKKVLLVIFMDSTHRAFQRAVAMVAPPQAEEVGMRMDVKRFGSTAGAIAQESPVRPVSAELLHSFQCNNVTVEIVNGDISVDDSEGIVNTASASLQLQTFGVMGALLKKGGQELQDACTAAVAEHGDLAEGKVILTGPGQRDGLKCKRVIHVIAPSSAGGLVATVKEALKRANKEGLRSVALPAIGTGQHGFTPADAACGIAEGILQFTKSANHHVEHIKVILFQREHFSSFAEAFEDAGRKKGFFRKTFDMVGNAFKAVRSMFDSSEHQQAVKRPSLIQASETLCIKVYAGAQSAIDNVFTEVDAFLQETIREEFVQDDRLDNLSSEVQLKLEGMATELGVQLSIDRTPINRATFKGTMTDVTVLKQEVVQELQAIERKESRKKEAELLTSKIQWQWKDKTDQFQDYAPEINLVVEKAHNEGQSSIRIETKEGPRTVVFNDMKETGDHPQFGTATQCNDVAVRRRDFEQERKEGEKPSFWDPMPRDPGTGKEVECHSVQLSATSQEYQDVAGQFNSTLRNTRNIVMIERIQNPKLYAQYLARKKTMDKFNPQHQNEKQLFHGCAGKVVDSINHGGFNRSYAGLHATAYGKGVYFARDASYSAQDTYSAHDPNGHKHMYLARVLTGEYTAGHGNLLVPPPKDPNNPAVSYDSVVDKVQNPNMFIIFYDSQAYPEYHIEF